MMLPLGQRQPDIACYALHMESTFHGIGQGPMLEQQFHRTDSAECCCPHQGVALVKLPPLVEVP